MQRSWLRSFAERHYPMLFWLTGVVVAAIGVTLILRSAVRDAPYALAVVPLLLLAGMAAALAEIVQAFRHHHGEARTIGFAIAGTIGLGIAALPLSATLAFATIRIADDATILGCFPTYQHVVAGVQRGEIVPTGAWQERDAVTFMTEGYPSQRIIFRLSDTGYSRSGIVYDPAGDVMTRAPTDLTAQDPRHHIGHATVRDCHAALITAYYRCDIWEFDDD